MLTRLTNAFPLWVALCSVLALIHPPLFLWFQSSFITYSLSIIMLGMGITLTIEDFTRVVRLPRSVILGVILHYTVMPFLGWSLGYIFHLPAPLAVGLILVACCPAGTASNVINYLARADLALSVTMTACSTILAVVMTPFLTAWLASSRIHVDAAGLLLSTLKVVIFPVVLGVILNRFFPRMTKRVLPVAPLIAVIFITLIVGSIMASGKSYILQSGWQLVAAVFSLHTCGFLLGYGFSRLMKADIIVARTVSIEVGMQNSGLGIVLAKENFPTMPLVAIPCAISSVFHSLIASLLAAWWRRKKVTSI